MGMAASMVSPTPAGAARGGKGVGILFFLASILPAPRWDSIRTSGAWPSRQIRKRIPTPFFGFRKEYDGGERRGPDESEPSTRRCGIMAVPAIGARRGTVDHLSEP